jgi:lipoate-protein ligase A
MRFVDISFDDPGENLAYDEVLLDRAETEDDAEVLRFWESPVTFVVLGTSQVLREHVREEQCAQDNVPILRRCTAGGCVLQGPGCLNFTLVLRHEHRPEIATIRGSYCYILGRIANTLRAQGVLASHKGISDLAVGGRKISGNSQRRRRHAILHHGTLLYGMDSELMERYLREPSERPQYRGNRTHRGFVKNVPISPNNLRDIICAEFDVRSRSDHPRRAELHAIRSLVQKKYSTIAWIRRR